MTTTWTLEDRLFASPAYRRAKTATAGSFALTHVVYAAWLAWAQRTASRS